MARAVAGVVEVVEVVEVAKVNLLVLTEKRKVERLNLLVAGNERGANVEVILVCFVIASFLVAPSVLYILNSRHHAACICVAMNCLRNPYT